MTMTRDSLYCWLSQSHHLSLPVTVIPVAHHPIYL